MIKFFRLRISGCAHLGACALAAQSVGPATPRDDGLAFGNTGNVTEFDAAVDNRVEILRDRPQAQIEPQ